MSQLRDTGFAKLDPDTLYTADYLSKLYGQNIYRMIQQHTLTGIQGYYYGAAVIRSLRKIFHADEASSKAANSGNGGRKLPKEERKAGNARNKDDRKDRISIDRVQGR